MLWRAQLVLTGPAKDRRGAIRRRLRLQAQLAAPAANGQDVLIRNLSKTGFLIETSAQLVPGDEIEVDLPPLGGVSAIVVWTLENLFGCEFARPVPLSTVSAVLLQAPFERQIEGHATERSDECKVDRNQAVGPPATGISLRAKAWAAVVLFGLLSWAIVGAIIFLQ